MLASFPQAISLLLASFVLAGAVGCSDNDEGPPDGGMDAGVDAGVVDGGERLPPPAPPAPYSDLVFDIEIIEAGDPALAAGFQSELLQTEDGTLFYVYLEFAGRDGECDIAVFGGGAAPSPRYDIRVARRAPNTDSWDIETVPLDQVPAPENQPFVAARFGVDALLEEDGTLVLAFAAGGPGLATCGSSDLVIGRRSPSGEWDFEVPLTDSDSCCEVCEAPECCADPACTSGSDVGAWAAMAQRPDGTVVTAFADYHFFWDQDGQTKQDLELFDGTEAIGVRPWSGLGAHTAVAAADDALVVATTGFAGGGMHVFRRGPDPSADPSATPAPTPTTTPTATPSPTASEDPDGEDPDGEDPDDEDPDDEAVEPFDEEAWTGVDLRPGWDVGERIALERAPDGHMALVFHARADDNGTLLNDLVYCRSTDTGFSFELPCQNIDARLAHLGQNPDLAFDGEGRPVVSYYVCGAGPNCDASADGLRIAVRDELERWWPIDVHFDGQRRSGLYSSLVFDRRTGLPIIAFQDLTRGAAMIAWGRRR